MSDEKADFETIRRAFAVFNSFQGPDCENLWWRTDNEYAPITLFVNCNDLFLWGCSDCEKLTPGNIADLEQAVKDAKAVGGEDGEIWGHLLFVARLRKLRPQKPYYKYFPEAMHALFDECGPRLTDAA